MKYFIYKENYSWRTRFILSTMRSLFVYTLVVENYDAYVTSFSEPVSVYVQTALKLKRIVCDYWKLKMSYVIDDNKRKNINFSRRYYLADG